MVLAGTAGAYLSSQVTNQSGVQSLLQDVGPMKRGHVECRRRGSGVAGSRVALSGNGGWGHVQRRRTLLIVLTVTLLIQGQGQALSLLSSVAEPNTYHLPTTVFVI